MILHLRVVPGLWVAVEECRHPELRSQALILGGLPHARGQVREANITAQQRGVRPGMTLSQAHHQCPDGLFLQPDLPSYSAVWERMCAVLQGYTPRVEPLEMGQAVCDLGGCEQLWGDDLTAARSILAAVRERTGIAPWIGVASNRITAQLASLSVGSEGIAVIQRGQEAVFLADLPLTSLPDLDARLALTFQVLGIRTLGELAALPAVSVKQRFGAGGAELHRLASGIDPRPVIPPPTKPVVEAREELEDGTVEEAIERLQRLADRCAGELRSRRLAGTMIELRLGGDPHPPSPLLPRVGEGGTDSGGSTPPRRHPLERVPGWNGGRGVRVTTGSETHFPISHRIHSSRLPQPLAGPAKQTMGQGFSPEAPRGLISPPIHGSPDTTPSIAGETPSAPDDRAQALPSENGAEHAVEKPVAEGFSPPAPQQYTERLTTVVRTPINTAAPLFEQARRLLLQRWQTLQEPPQSIEMIVSEFPAPRQLAFAELNRIGETGGLGGLDATRLQALAESERALAARFGDASFRHIGRVDPANLLTERRFHWKHGLPWKGA